MIKKGRDYYVIGLSTTEQIIREFAGIASEFRVHFATLQILAEYIDSTTADISKKGVNDEIWSKRVKMY